MKKVFAHAVTVGLALSGSVATYAAEDEAVIEEVIVSATRRDVAVMDLPLSIQAVSAEQLQLPTFREMNQVMNLVPGATVFSNKAPNKEGVQMRGSGVSQSGASDGQAPVGYYVDDIPYVDISTPVPPPIGTFDLERVEIIRGPQGTSYGQDSSGGSVIMRTAPVDLEKLGYKVRAGVTDVSNVEGMGHTVGGVVNLPIVEGTFGVRLAYQRDEDPGYGRIDGQPEIENPLESTRDSLRIKAFLKASERLSFEASHTEWNTEYGFLPGTQILDSRGGDMVLYPVSTGMLLELFPDGNVSNEFEISWTTFKAELELDFANLTYSAGFVDTPRKETNSEFSFDIGFGPLFSGVVFNQPAESFTQEVRLVSNVEGDFQWLAGMFFLDAESNSRGWTSTPAFFFHEEISDPIDAEAWAVYAEAEYAINEQWSVLGGLRFHDEERTYTSEYAVSFGGDPTFGPFSFPSPTTVEQRDFDSLSYRLGLTWAPNDQGLVYLTQSSANRAPIVMPQSDRIALENAGVAPPGDADAAELINTEIGTKWSFADGRVQLELVYAYGDWKDIPIWAQLAIPPQPVSVAIGGTDAIVETWEAIFRLALTDYLSVGYAGAFTETEVEGVPNGGLVTGFPPSIREGGELYNYSPTTHNVDISYFRELANGWSLFASVNYVTRDKPNGVSVFNFFAPDYVPAESDYKNLGVNAGLSKGPWDFTFSVNNASGEDGRFLPGSQGAVGGIWGLIQPPRSMSFQVSYDGF